MSSSDSYLNNDAYGGWDVNRRQLIQTTGLTVLSGLAGCNDTTQNKADQPTPTGTPTPSYELDVSLSKVDLSDLNGLELGSMDGIRDDDHFILEYELLEDGEKIEYDDRLEAELESGGTLELGPEIDNAYEIACNQIRNGEELTVNAEINGETVQTKTKADKVLPDTFKVDLEQDSPYAFDSIPKWEQYFWEKAKEHHEYMISATDITERTLEKDEVDFFPEDDENPKNAGIPYSHGEKNWSTSHFKSLDPVEDREKLLNDSMVAWRQDYAARDGSAASTKDNAMAHHQKELIITHTDLEFKDILAFGVRNETHGTANHYFTDTGEIITSDPVGWVGPPEKQPDHDDEDFATIPHYETGHVETTSFEKKKSYGVTAYRGPASIWDAEPRGINQVYIQDSVIEDGMQAMMDNNFESHFERAKKLTTAAKFFGPEGFNTFSFMNDERDEIIVSKDEDLKNKYRKRVQEPTWEDVKEAA